MENATKALLIAATVLIAVLILSVGIYVFNHYMGFAYENEENRAKQALIQYNTKFEKYIDKSLTMQDVYTIVNLAKDYNERKSEYGISVNSRKLGNLLAQNKNDEWWVEKLDEYSKKYASNPNSIEYYEIERIEHYDDGTIKEINIK